jgi:hypothetical protein
MKTTKPLSKQSVLLSRFEASTSRIRIYSVTLTPCRPVTVLRLAGRFSPSRWCDDINMDPLCTCISILNATYYLVTLLPHYMVRPCTANNRCCLSCWNSCTTSTSSNCTNNTHNKGMQRESKNEKYSQACISFKQIDDDNNGNNINMLINLNFNSWLNSF